MDKMKVKEMTKYEKEVYYCWKFEMLSQNWNYIMQPREEITQCLSEAENGRYYEPAWFVSNYGYLFSVHGKSIRVVKPNVKFGGKKGYCLDRVTEYIKAYCNKIPDGRAPQYYFYRNSLNGKDVMMHRLINHYFPDPFAMDGTGPYDVHHKDSMNWKLPPQRNNYAKNLQRVPKKLHVEMTNLSMMSPEQFDKKMEEAPVKFYVRNLTWDNMVSQLTHGGFCIVNLRDENGESTWTSAVGL